MHKPLYYFGTHGNYSMVIGKVGTNWYNLNKKLVGLKMAIFQNQVKKRVIIHYSSFDPPCPFLGAKKVTLSLKNGVNFSIDP
jgi:hypothetical protein